LPFPKRNNECVVALQQRGQYIRYDKQVAFLIDGSIEKLVAEVDGGAIGARPAPVCARRHPPTARYLDLEIGSCAEMPVMPDAALFATGAHDQADHAALGQQIPVFARLFVHYSRPPHKYEKTTENRVL
jgi:hypothetical protein